MRKKRAFHLIPEISETLDRLLLTRSATSESAAMAMFVFALDEALRERLDDRGLRDYLRGKLTREAMFAAFERQKASNGPARAVA